VIDERGPVPPPSGVFHLAFVCTANQCRSPMAATLAARELLRRGIAAEVASGGVLPGGMPASKGAVRTMAERGLDLSSHESHTMDGRLLAWSDLVLTMERRHLIEVAELDLVFLERSFTIRELADLGMLLGPRSADEPPSGWIARAAAARDPARVLSVRSPDDLPDPMGGSRRDSRRAADELEERISTILTNLFPDHPRPD
jgi:protein-tyrosine phosphatase